MKLDLIIKNAKVITMDDYIQEADSVAVKDGKFVKVGKYKDIMGLCSKNTKIIDLEGKMLIPGFNDSHMHLLSYGLSLQKVDLRGLKSIDEIILKIKDYILEKDIKPGKWVQGIGWNQDYFDIKAFPTKQDLDKISLDNPICIVRACYHVAVVNSKALEVVGVGKNTCRISGGEFDVDEYGELKGVFRENAVRLIYDKIEEPDELELKNIILEASRDANSKGITSIQTDDFEHISSKNYEKIIKAYTNLHDEGKLVVRVNEQCLLPNVQKLTDFLDKGYITGWGDEFFKIGPLKLLSDGSLGARTAALSNPYADDTSSNGILVYTQEELDELVTTAHNNGMQIAIHCIGDAAMYMAFKSFDLSQKQNYKFDSRHSIVHCQITDDILLDKFKQQEVIAHIQPIFLNYDLHIVEDRVGRERAKTTYNFKTMVESGVHIACGSDCPVEKFDVLPNIYCLVTRKDLSGYPPSGWLPQQKLSIYEALYGFTMGGAFASFEEKIKGSISVGKYADMVVLSEDIFNIEEDLIKDVEVLMTFVDGNIVYENDMRRNKYERK